MNAHTAIQPTVPLPTEHDPRWSAIVARDATADGAFYYSVATTGVYCFPSCAARPANPRNVRFHLTRDDAERAGFRPCKRCKPDRERGEKRVRQPLAADVIRFAIKPSSIGLVLVAQCGTGANGVCAVLLGDDREVLRHELQGRFPGASLGDGDASLDAVASRIVRYIESPANGLELLMDVPLEMRGTEFQRNVWRALRSIPAGSTESYANVARRIGMPNATRAVAQACAANPLAVVVPCHRVVRSDGRLSGYRWGVERKRALLELEGSA